MTVEERILAIELMEDIRKQPEYAKKIGLSVEVNNNKDKKQKLNKTDDRRNRNM